MKACWFYSLVFLLATVGTKTDAQDTLFSQRDILIRGGMLVDYKQQEGYDKHVLTADLNLGVEYFLFKKISIGFEVDYYINGFKFVTLDNRTIRFGDFYSTAFINLYNKNLYYLHAAFCLHKNPSQYFQYPEDFIEYQYKLGGGKRFPISDHIIGTVGVDLVGKKINSLDTFGQPVKTLGLMISLHTGILIYIDPKTN